MSIASLRQSLPAYAEDIGLNLSSLAAETVLTDQQKWGCFIASAYAVGSGPVIHAMEAAAREAGVSDEAITAAKAAAAIMGMNNVYYRALYLMHEGEYRTMPARLHMTVIANPGVEKMDFDLWCMAVSAVNGCAACMISHERGLKTLGATALAIQATLRIGAVVFAASRVIEAERAAAA